MKDRELPVDRSCHVLYTRSCKKEIQKKLALHYPSEKRGELWEKIQRKWGGDLGKH